MLPHEYVDLHWDKSPRDTFKPLTRPRKALYKNAWELDLFPRLSSPRRYTMLYKSVCASNDDEPLLYQDKDYDEDEEEEEDEDCIPVVCTGTQTLGPAAPAAVVRQVKPTWPKRSACSKVADQAKCTATSSQTPTRTMTHALRTGRGSRACTRGDGRPISTATTSGFGITTKTRKRGGCLLWATMMTMMMMMTTTTMRMRGQETSGNGSSSRR